MSQPTTHLWPESSLRFAALLLPLSIFTACEKQAPSVIAPAPVRVAAATEETVQIEREFIGRLNGSANVDVRAKVSGFITAVEFSEGKQVRKGDVLLRIDARPFEAALAQARAELTKAIATQGKTEADEKRQTQLYQTKAASEQDYQNAVQANLAAKAAIEAARAAETQAALNLEFATVIAPINGLIGRTDFTVGDFLPAGAGGTAVATLSNLDPMDFEFSITEKDYLLGAENLNRVIELPETERPSNLVLIRADGQRHSEKGSFVTINRGVEEATGSILAKARFANPGNILRPGQFARIVVPTKKLDAAILVPEVAIAELQGRSFVWTIGADSKAVRRPVTVAHRQNGRAIIAEGLAKGENVVVEGAQALSEGRSTAILPQPASPAAAVKPAQ